jgi:conjugative relaxase-like TrwC/TraI family protein
MLSIKAIKSAGVTSTYFAKDDYYTKDWAEAQKESLWYGAGAERLGLTGPVTQEAFQALLEGKLADGTGCSCSFSKMCFSIL